MPDKEARMKLKQIEREISKLEKERQKVEYRPCRGDSELKQKELDLQAIRQKMNQLEKKRDRYILNSGGVKHFEWENSSPKK